MQPSEGKQAGAPSGELERPERKMEHKREKVEPSQRWKMLNIDQRYEEYAHLNYKNTHNSLGEGKAAINN